MAKSKRRWLDLDWNSPDALRAQDIPYDASLSIKDAISMSVSGATGLQGATGIQGPVGGLGQTGVQGQTGVGFGTVHAFDVLYYNADHTDKSTVQLALDYLMYVPLSYSLSLTPSVRHKGQIATDMTASWTHNNTLSTQNITIIGAQGGSISPSALSFIYTGLSLTTDQAVTVIGTDTYPTTASATSYLRFELYKYWGQSASSTPTETIIEAALNGGSTLSVDTASSRVKSTYSQAGGAQYLYYAYPQAWGTATIYVNGFLTVWNLTTVSVTNAYANTQNYYCYTSPTTIAGSVTVQIA